MPEIDPPTYIHDADGVEALCRWLRKSRAVAVDCEANSFHAYHERLCLMQLTADGRDFILDPLAEGVELAPLVPIFADPAILKVFHDAEFDILLIKRALPLEICGLFDTRVAASSLGLQAVGLAALLDEYFGVETDKKYQRSDWGQRPLEPAQLQYAQRDTHWLLPLAAKIRRMLHEADPVHLQEVAAECRRLEALEPLPKAPGEEGLPRIKGLGRLDARRQKVAERLNAWRHREASGLDKPLYRVLGNDHLLGVASAAPTSMSELLRSRALPEKLAKRYGTQLVEVVAEALQAGADRRSSRKRSAEEPPPIDKNVYEALRGWRRETAERRGTDASLVLPRQTMEALARMDRLPATERELALTGLFERWRLELYGDGILHALARTGT